MNIKNNRKPRITNKDVSTVFKQWFKAVNANENYGEIGSIFIEQNKSRYIIKMQINRSGGLRSIFGHNNYFTAKEIYEKMIAGIESINVKNECNNVMMFGKI